MSSPLGGGAATGAGVGTAVAAFLIRAPRLLDHHVFTSFSDIGGPPIPSDHLKLVSDMLPAGVDITEQLAEGLFVINASGSGCPD